MKYVYSPELPAHCAHTYTSWMIAWMNVKLTLSGARTGVDEVVDDLVLLERGRRAFLMEPHEKVLKGLISVI